MAWVEKFAIATKSIPKTYNIYFAGDLQIGSSSTDTVIVRNWVRKVCSDPNAIWCLLGDIEDDDRPTTRIIRKGAFSGRKEVLGNDAKKHRRWVDQEIVPILKPLVDAGRRCLGVLAGHHWYDLGEQTSTQYICNALTAYGKVKVPYLGQMSAWVRFIVKDNRGTSIERLIHIQHGTGGGKAISSALNALVKTSQGFGADLYVRAHDCTLVTGKYDILQPIRPRSGSPERLTSKTVTLMNIGAATRGYELSKGDPSYVEMGMMNPRTLGWGIAHLTMFRQSRVYDPQCNSTVNITVEI